MIASVYVWHFMCLIVFVIAWCYFLSPYRHIVTITTILARRAYLADPADYMFCCCFLFYYFIYFNDSFQTNYLKIYETDHRRVCRVGRTPAVDDQSEIRFSIHQEGTLPWQPIFVGFVHGTEFRWHSADGISVR